MNNELHYLSLQDHSPVEQRIIIILYSIKYGCDKNILEFVSGLSCPQLMAVLNTMESDHIIVKNNFIWTLDNSLIPKDILTVLGKYSDSDLLYVFSFFYQGMYKSFFKKAYAFMQMYFHSHKYNECKILYTIFSKTFIRLRISITDYNLCSDYLSISYKMISFAHMFPWNVRETLIWILKQRGLALVTKNIKYVSMLNLSLGYLCATGFSTNKNKRFLEIAKKEISTDSRINDIKIASYAVPFKSFIHYLEGDFIKSINCIFYFSDANFDPENYYMRISFNYATMSAVVNGEYDIALTIINTGIRLTENSEQQECAYDILIIFRAFVLMLKGEDKEFRVILEKYDIDEFQKKPTMASLWLIRLRIYFYYMHNDIEQAYAIYIAGMKDTVTHGYTGYILAPFMLEILTQFHLSGFQDPFDTSIFSEITFALNSPSILLHTVAYRMLAELISRRDGWESMEAQSALQSSLIQSYTLSAPLERAKTSITYVQMLVALDKKDEIGVLLNEIHNTKSRYPQLVIPQDIAALLSQTKPEPKPAEKRDQIPSGVVSPLVEEDVTGFFYACDEMQQLLDHVAIVASKDVAVCILGESGVGKEHIARQLHNLSGRKGKFVAVNLASISEELFESEFYGHEKGAFTGAAYSKKGLFELADAGTLFLDEIGDIPMRMQIKLLRVLQEKEFFRVGGLKLIRSEFRIISATNKNLIEEIQNGIFREDLYYRINVVSLTVPPLRKRNHDVVLIAEKFLNIFTRNYGLSSLLFSQDDIAFLLSYSWPGNVRELKNYIERYVLFSDQELKAGSSDLHKQDSCTRVLQNVFPGDALIATKPEVNIFLEHPDWISRSNMPSLEILQANYIEFVYVIKNGNVGGAHGIAETLGVSKVTVYNWIRKLDLKRRFAKKITVTTPYKP